MRAVLPRLAVPIVIALLVAGCASPSPPGEVEAASADEAPAPDAPAPAAPELEATAPADEPAAEDVQPVLSQFGCTTTFATFVVPRAWADERMPPGLTPRSFSGEGDVATFAVKTWGCPRATLGAEDLGASDSVVYYLAVTPARHLSHPDISTYWLPLGFATSNPALAEVFARWNLGASAADVAIETTRAPPAEVVRTRASAERFTLDMQVAATGADAGGSYTVWYFGVKDGEVSNAVAIPVSAHLQGGGASLVDLRGEHAPVDTPFQGGGTIQTWEADAHSYDWIHVALPTAAENA